MSTCPFCHIQQGQQLALNGPPDARPELGVSAAICWSCQRVSVIEVSPLWIVRRKPTPQEQAWIDGRVDIQLALAAIATARPILGDKP